MRTASGPDHWSKRRFLRGDEPAVPSLNVRKVIPSEAVFGKALVWACVLPVEHLYWAQAVDNVICTHLDVTQGSVLR